jgi:hypothetical protein
MSDREVKSTESVAGPAGSAGLPGGAGSGKSGEATPHLSSIDFSTFILSLSTSALYQLGLVPGPGGQIVEPDPLLAHQTIETLKMIRSKTSGNLEEEERKLLDSLLYELHTQFAKHERK